jgi:radical SAM superfamily enzyme YgiQ (UPF0313 family)
MDCLLVYPEPTQDSPSIYPAFSIFYVGASLERAGYDVEYIDLRFDPQSRLSKALTKNPLCVGVSSMTGYQLEGAIEVLKKVKNHNPDIKTTLGGVHPSLLPRQCLQERFVDFVVVGEGEETACELMNYLKNHRNDFQTINGLAWKKNGDIIINQPRPPIKPDRWIFPLNDKTKRYFRIAIKGGSMVILSSRGCWRRCGFCYVQAFHKRKWRPMPIDKFEKELNMYLSELSFNTASLGDENIGKKFNRIEGLSRVLREHAIEWHTGISCDCISKEIIKTMEWGGCKSFEVGVESGSPRVLNDVICKDYVEGVATIKKSVKIIAKSDISPMYSFMAGLPTETKAELKMSMDLADWIKKVDDKARASFFVYTPYPETPMYKMAIQEGFDPPKNMQDWSKFSLSHALNPKIENLYYIAGLTFRKDNIKRNFPGVYRLKIMPFEFTAYARWKTRLLDHYLAKSMVKNIIKKAVERRNVEIERIIKEELSE